MKKETTGSQMGWAYFYLTVIFTLFMVYLKFAEGWPISWWLVFAPLWGSVLLTLVVCGVAFLLIRKNLKNDKKD